MQTSKVHSNSDKCDTWGSFSEQHYWPSRNLSLISAFGLLCPRLLKVKKSFLVVLKLMWAELLWCSFMVSLLQCCPFFLSRCHGSSNDSCSDSRIQDGVTKQAGFLLSAFSKLKVEFLCSSLFGFNLYNAKNALRRLFYLDSDSQKDRLQSLLTPDLSGSCWTLILNDFPKLDTYTDSKLE